MIVEKVFDKKQSPAFQRRPDGHVLTGQTKKGNKRRGLRGRMAGLLEEETVSGDEDEEDDCPICNS